MKTAQTQTKPPTQISTLKLVVVAVLLFALLLVGFVFTTIVVVPLSYVTVKPDETALIYRFGKYHNNLNPGLHHKYPFVDLAIIVRKHRIFQRTFDSQNMITGDRKLVTVNWIVQYKISNAKNFHNNVSDVGLFIDNISLVIMSRLVGDFAYQEVLVSSRTSIADQALKLIQEQLDLYQAGIKIVALNFIGVFPPKEVRPAFNDILQAKKDADQIVQKAKEELYKRNQLQR